MEALDTSTQVEHTDKRPVHNAPNLDTAFSLWKRKCILFSSFTYIYYYFIYLLIYPFIYLFIYLFNYLFIYYRIF